MATDITPTDTLEFATQQLSLLGALANAAADLAERSKSNDITQVERVSLRNQAKLANEQAGTLLTRGTIVLFGSPPSDAAKQIDEAIAGTQATLTNIQKVKDAIKFVSALVGVSIAVLSGDWKAVLKSLETLATKSKN